MFLLLKKLHSFDIRLMLILKKQRLLVILALSKGVKDLKASNAP